MPYDYQNSHHFLQGSVRTYTKATKMLQEVWCHIFDEELVLTAVDPRPRYEEAVKRVADQMDRQDGESLMNELRGKEANAPDVAGLSDDVEEEVFAKREGVVARDIDDVSPNMCKQMIRDAIQDLALMEDGDIVDLLLWDVLRLAMRRLAPNMDWPSPARVGANANFPRLWQYVCELCKEISAEDEGAMCVIAVRGRLPKSPVGPGALRIRLRRYAL